MRHAGPSRRELGVPTVFNLLGPLSNPAGSPARSSASPTPLAERVAGVLRGPGAERALVVHGGDGLDELTTTETSTVVEVRDGEVSTWDVDPAALGLRRVDREDLVGGTPTDNAASPAGAGGEHGPHRDIVVLNAAAGLLRGRAGDDLADGVAAAREALDRRRGRRPRCPGREQLARVAAHRRGVQQASCVRTDADNNRYHRGDARRDAHAALRRAGDADPTRDKLIAAAAEVFAEKGYDGAGVQEIARRAGFTTGAIYGRFRGKAELLLAAIEAHHDSELERLFAAHRFEGKVTDILTTVGSHLVTDEFGRTARCCSRRSSPPGAIPRWPARVRSRSTCAATARRTRQRGEGHRRHRPGLDTESIVRFCHAVGFGFLLFGAVDLDLPDVRAVGAPHRTPRRSPRRRPTVHERR